MKSLRAHSVVLLYALAFFFVLILFTASRVAAQSNSFAVTVTPSLVQLSVGPGESWSSSLKVVNNNNFDTTYHLQVMDFEANGEDGSAKYVPVLEDPAHASQTHSLASWIKLNQTSVFVRAGESARVPYSLLVPPNAEPGGHYAAILVGSKPSDTVASSSVTKISSYVSSLLFVKISGQVIENGRIREFSTARSIYQTPQTNFLLRFENIGNTHLRPQGDIVIYNMWGKERGRVGINLEEGNFGNVLPKSIRKFQFSWEGEASPFDIGHYRAVVTLAYGENGRKNIVAKTSFWVIPTAPLVTTLSICVAFIFLFSWFIRRYIRRALELERGRLTKTSAEPAANIHAFKALIEPIKEGVVDLRRTQQMVAPKAPTMTVTPEVITLSRGEFVQKYRSFFWFVAIVVLGAALTWWYLDKALVQSREYKIKEVSAQIEAQTATR
ncbi:MAG: hypothetical protein RIQ56_100 [Candidatus Parcubacteria bacterium]